ncbi:hypothetical protein HMPREF1548_01542 [Clostridium sp. KLE 1755]|nr:hypothetical protein HMPREF1548_01542 [Clostridium sp. KLE 1755]
MQIIKGGYLYFGQFLFGVCARLVAIKKERNKFPFPSFLWGGLLPFSLICFNLDGCGKD